MKITHIEKLIACGEFAESNEWIEVRDHLHLSIRAVDWPVGSGLFTIYPESGKRRGQGNGVTPIKVELVKELADRGWMLEEGIAVTSAHRPGKFDAVFYSESGPVAFEWETGNISSSHRALNKMALGLLKRTLVCGILVVPSRALYRFLTDRVGNFDELQPYLDLWRSIPCDNGILEIVVIEHDATSTNVPRIPKGTSGRALQ